MDLKGGRRLVIVRRQSPDWGSLDEGYFAHTPAFDRIMDRPIGTAERLIRAWDDALDLSFFQCRAAMKAIAADNWAAVTGAHLADLADFTRALDPRALYAFIDDDDWFAPDLARALATTGDVDAVVWRSVRFDGALTPRPVGPFAYTNNYALSGAFLAGDGRAREASQHNGANAALENAGIAPLVLEEPLSVTNKHPCSTVELERAVRDHGPAGPVRLVEGLVARAAGYAPVPGLEWVTPLAARVERLFAGVRARRGS